MQPGPTLVVKPTGCTTPLKVPTMGSGNTFGAVFWTDGKCEAPMLEDEPWLRKHPGENRLFWAGDWELLESLEFDGHFGPGKNWADLPYAETPTEDDYFVALGTGVADSEEKQRYIRTRLWWLGNDPIRMNGVGSLPPRHIDNLSRLALLLSEDDPQQCLMKAEAYREMGFFDDAERLLSGRFPQELADAVREVEQLAMRMDVRVARFSW